MERANEDGNLKLIEVSMFSFVLTTMDYFFFMNDNYWIRLSYMIWWIMQILEHPVRSAALFFRPYSSSLNNCYYYRFKIFRRFWLLQTLWLILYNQLALAKYHRFVYCLSGLVSRQISHRSTSRRGSLAVYSRVNFKKQNKKQTNMAFAAGWRRNGWIFG